MDQLKQQQNAKIQWPKYIKYMSAATILITLTNPIQVIKTRLQVSPQLLHKNIITHPYLTIPQTTQRILKQEGPKGLFAGVGPFIMRTLPANIGVFTVKEIIHRKLTQYVRFGGRDSWLRKMVEKHYFVVNGAIGGFAGFVIQVVIYPFDYLRIVISNNIHNHPNHPNQTIFSSIAQTLKNKGYKGMFNGVTMNLIYMTLARAIYFGLFDSAKHNAKSQVEKYTYSYLSISAALLLCYPLDTVRKRVIMGKGRYLNGRECFRHIFKQEKLSMYMIGWRIIAIHSIFFSSLLYLYDRMFTQIFRPKPL